MGKKIWDGWGHGEISPGTLGRRHLMLEAKIYDIVGKDSFDELGIELGIDEHQLISFVETMSQSEADVLKMFYKGHERYGGINWVTSSRNDSDPLKALEGEAGRRIRKALNARARKRRKRQRCTR